MQYGAVTIDTNIVSINRYNLEGGLLIRLHQFQGAAISFIISEIVFREINRHLVEQARESKQALGKAITKSNFNALHDAEGISKLREILDLSIDPKKAARSRLERFLGTTGAQVIPAEKTDIATLIKLYFETAAPFENSGKKKNEFPDAIALLSLESWGRENGKKILAISADEGWFDFAKTSEWIDVEPDLKKALELLQVHTAEARDIVARFVTGLSEGRYRRSYRHMLGEITKRVQSRIYYGFADSAYKAETDYVEAELVNFDFSSDIEEGIIFDIIEIDAGKIVVTVGVDLRILFKADFRIYLWDSVDKEEIGMGSTDALVEKDIDASVILTIKLSEDLEGSDMYLEEAELIDDFDGVDFGYVELDLGAPDPWDETEPPAWLKLAEPDPEL